MGKRRTIKKHPLIERAVDMLGSQQKLAAAIGVHQTFVSKMLREGCIPAEQCVSIERATGGVITRRDLRPDLFGDIAA